jgi:hypothetical protein
MYIVSGQLHASSKVATAAAVCGDRGWKPTTEKIPAA